MVLIGEQFPKALVRLGLDGDYYRTMVILGDEEEIDVRLFTAKTVYRDASFRLGAPSTHRPDVGAVGEHLRDFRLYARCCGDPCSGVFLRATPSFPMDAAFWWREAMPLVDSGQPSVAFPDSADGRMDVRNGIGHGRFVGSAFGCLKNVDSYWGRV